MVSFPGCLNLRIGLKSRFPFICCLRCRFSFLFFSLFIWIFALFFQLKTEEKRKKGYISFETTNNKLCHHFKFSFIFTTTPTHRHAECSCLIIVIKTMPTPPTLHTLLMVFLDILCAYIRTSILLLCVICILWNAKYKRIMSGMHAINCDEPERSNGPWMVIYLFHSVFTVYLSYVTAHREKKNNIGCIILIFDFFFV